MQRINIPFNEPLFSRIKLLILFNDEVEYITENEYSKIIVKWEFNNFYKNNKRLFKNTRLMHKEFSICILDSDEIINENLNHKRYTLIEEDYEIKRLLLLLLGAEDSKQILFKKEIFIYELIGQNGWKNFEEFITFANLTCNWLVLRNFNFLPNNFFGNDKDVDILCSDIDIFIQNMNLEKKNSSLFNYKTKIDGKTVDFDVRVLGDGYYDKLWQYKILYKKIYAQGIVPRMDDKNFFYSLLYHCKVQKTNVKEEYINVLMNLSKKIHIEAIDKKTILNDQRSSELLKEFMKKNKYQYNESNDINVVENKKFIKLINNKKEYRNIKILNKKIKKIIYTFLPIGIKKILYSFFKIKKPKFIILFLGPDGAGKTTTINFIQKQLPLESSTLYGGVGYSGWIFHIFYRLREKSKSNIFYKKVYGRFFLYFLYPLELIVRKFISYKEGNNLLLVDRCPEIIIKSKFINLFHNFLFPTPNIVFLLTAPPGVLVSRKPEELNINLAKEKIKNEKKLAFFYEKKKAKIISIDTSINSINSIKKIVEDEIWQLESFERSIFHD